MENNEFAQIPLPGVGESGIVANNTGNAIAQGQLTGELTGEQLVEIAKSNLLAVTGLVTKVATIESIVQTDLQNRPLTEDHADDIHDAVNRRVYDILGFRKHKRMTEEQKRFRKVYGDAYFDAIWHYLKKKYKVSRYRQIKEIQYEDALHDAENWVPEDEDEIRRDAEENWRINNPGKSLHEFLGTLPL